MDEKLEHIELNKRFREEILDPKELITKFKDEREFINWLHSSDGKYMHDAWEAFFEAELMDICDIIAEEIKKTQ